MGRLEERVNGVERTANSALAKTDQIHELKSDIRAQNVKDRLITAFLAAIGVAALNYFVERLK